MAEVKRAFRYALDPTPEQERMLWRCAGNARMAYNFALSEKVKAHRGWREELDALIASGLTEAQARSRLRGKIKIPSKREAIKSFNAVSDDPDTDGGAPWRKEIPSYVFQSGMDDADRAWKNWLDSRTGKRTGAQMGYPRYKKKFRSKDSFRLYNDIAAPKQRLRLEGYRRLRLHEKIGSKNKKFAGTVRVHGSAKPLHRLISSGKAVINSVTVSRGGSRWYASVQCTVQQDLPGPTRRQRRNGGVGVDLGVAHLATLSQPLEGVSFVENPRYLQRSADRLARAQRRLSRTSKGSARRRRAAQRVAKIHHLIAEQRATYLHQLSKRLTTTFETVALEELNVAGMTRSARGTRERPGKNVRAKAGLNRSLLDAAPGELRRQVGYKARWYGSRVALCDRWFPSSQTCSDCGWRNTSLPLSQRVFVCAECGLRMDRDLNAAHNIFAHAKVPPDGTGTPGEGPRTPVEEASVRSSSDGPAGASSETGRQPPPRGGATSVEHPPTSQQCMSQKDNGRH